MRPANTPGELLRLALEVCFQIIRDEADGRLTPLPTIRSRWLTLQRAWDGCPDAEQVYRETALTWHAREGRCHDCGSRARCPDSPMDRATPRAMDVEPATAVRAESRWPVLAISQAGAAVPEAGNR